MAAPPFPAAQLLALHTQMNLLITTVVTMSDGTQKPYFAVEHNVNGIWNAFLNVLCPTVTAHFVINPEAYPKIGDTSGLKTDFLVRRLTPSAPPGTYSTKAWLAYEGKGGANTENILDQLRVYLDDWCDKKQGAACWAVGARGRQVMFWRYTGKATEKMIPLKVVVLANNTLEVKEGIEGWTFAFDFVTDMAKIQAVLQYLWYKEPTP